MGPRKKISTQGQLGGEYTCDFELWPDFRVIFGVAIHLGYT